ncbi:hypothetical protein FisN_7Hh041 [Fistulifera solaris]|uniref:Uncharacterized protein n=1 Tax=Fistulifera solaris TaxID=1519565 RepID=A0A1Z5K3T5_FISSO|nr:hypothetical protein FisN_7Hh041 [Fistulifera solaris]|eukprot:GAX20731.1 hypothetical protein FisN_7Hh041 [Fistulifera solaris]
MHTTRQAVVSLWLSFLTLCCVPSHAELRWLSYDESSSFLNAMQRYLEIGDFQSINDGLSGVQLVVPDPEPITTTLLFTLTVEVTNLVCEQINIGDLQSNYNATNTEMNFAIELYPFAMTCTGNYAYNYGAFIANSGTLTATISESRIQLGLGFTSPDFATTPPNATQVAQCAASLQIEQMSFSGDLENTIANLFREGVEDLVSNGAQTALCEDASTAFSFLDDMIVKLNDVIGNLTEPITEEQLDPLRNERNLDVPIDRRTTLIQLMEGGGTISKTVQSLLDEADQMLGEMVTDPNNLGTQDLAVNVWLRDYLLDANGMFALNLAELGISSSVFKTHNKIFAVDIDLNSFKIKGLDTLKVFNPLDRIGNYTIQNEMAWEKLSLEIELVADFQTSTLPDTLLLSTIPVKGRETVTLSMDMQDVQVSLAALLALLEEEVGNTEIGSLLRLNYILPCMANSVAELAISGLGVSLGSLSDPVFSGIGSPGVSRLLSSVIQATFAMYKPLMLKSIPGAFQGPIRRMINKNYIEKNLADPTCSSIVQGNEASPYLDFRDLLRTRSEAIELGTSGDTPYGSTVALAWKFIQDWLLTPAEGSSDIPLNTRFIAPFTEKQSGIPGSIAYKDALIDQKFALLDADVHFRVFDIYAENLDTMGEPLSLLDTVQGEAHLINNVATVGVNKPLRAGAKINLQMDGSGVSIDDQMSVEIEAESLSLVLDLILNVMTDAFVQFPLKDISNVNCLMALLQPPSLDSRGARLEDGPMPYVLRNLTTSFAQLNLNVTCTDCKSEAMLKVAEHFSSAEGTQSGTELAEGILDLLTETVGADFLALQLDRQIANARFKCPHHPDYNPASAERDFDDFDAVKREESLEFIISLAIAALALMIGLAVFMIIIRVFARRQHKKWLETISDSQALSVWKHQQKEKEDKTKMNATSSALYNSQAIPLIARILIPLVIVGCVGLFLAGHLSIAASVSLIISLAEQEYRNDSFFEFSIATGTINLWKAGGYELAILIILFSGVWPYLKQTMSLILWFVPPSIVSVEKRGRTFLWLDFLAKWSMVDIFTLMISLVAFRTTVQSPNGGILPDDLYNIEIMVIPKLGLYANFIAQIVSQVSSHYIIHYHVKAVDESRKRLRQPTARMDGEETGNESLSSTSSEAELQEPVSLATTAYRRPHRGDNKALVARSFVAPLLLLSGAVVVAFVVAGCVLPSFSAEVMGFFGIAVELGKGPDTEAVTHYSLFKMIEILFKQATYSGDVGDYIGLGALSALLIATVCIIPVLQTALLLSSWFVSMNQARRKRLVFFNDILQAWQYTEVYALSVVVGSWQLGNISYYMVNIYCDQLNALKSLFSQLVYFGVIEPDDAQCFLVEAQARTGFFFIAAGSILLALMNTFISKAANHYIRDNVEKPSLSGIEPKTQVDSDELKEEIDPIPILFTDEFRFCLRRTLGELQSAETGQSEMSYLDE